MKNVIDLGFHRIDERALGAFGFVRSRTVWRLSRPLGFGDLSLVAVFPGMAHEQENVGDGGL